MPPPPPPPRPRPKWPIPTLNVRVDDLAHPGAKLFFESVNPADALRDAVTAVFQWLYVTTASAPAHVRSVDLILRAFPGVAYTTGTHTAKQIHLSLTHVVASASPVSPARARDEIRGVLTHEAVHCFQHNARGTCPSGLVEGIADWVRLRANLTPPHWRARPTDRWDAGYDATAYFLAWLEARHGPRTVPALNAALDSGSDADADSSDGSALGPAYDDAVFHRLTGSSVDDLWRAYCADLRARA